MTTVGELKKVLDALKEKNNITVSAVVSKSGIPIVWNLPDENQVETFATLSATITGASEVICSGLNKSSPKKIVIETEEGTMMATILGPKALFIVMSSQSATELEPLVKEAARNIKEVLANEGA